MSSKTLEALVAAIIDNSAVALQSALRLAVIVAVAYLVIRILRRVVARLETWLIHSTGHGESDPGAAAKRIKT